MSRQNSRPLASHQTAHPLGHQLHPNRHSRDTPSWPRFFTPIEARTSQFGPTLTSRPSGFISARAALSFAIEIEGAAHMSRCEQNHSISADRLLRVVHWVTLGRPSGSAALASLSPALVCERLTDMRGRPWRSRRSFGALRTRVFTAGIGCTAVTRCIQSGFSSPICLQW